MTTTPGTPLRVGTHRGGQRVWGGTPGRGGASRPVPDDTPQPNSPPRYNIGDDFNPQQGQGINWIPRLQGRSETERKRYERQVEFGVQGSNLEPGKQASRLMSGLSDRAEEAVRWLRARDVSSDTEFDPENLDNGSGVGKLLQTLRTLKMTPDQQLEAASEKFFVLCRASGEEHHRYMTRASDVRRELKEEDSSFTMGDGM